MIKSDTENGTDLLEEFAKGPNAEPPEDEWVADYIQAGEVNPSIPIDDEQGKVIGS